LEYGQAGSRHCRSCRQTKDQPVEDISSQGAPIDRKQEVHIDCKMVAEKAVILETRFLLTFLPIRLSS
jgi:hypothetical protein